jgi:hypothetical protein
MVDWGTVGCIISSVILLVLAEHGLRVDQYPKTVYHMIGRKEAVYRVCEMKELLTKHLREQEMSYFQHLLHALVYSATLAVCSVVLVFHAFFPFVLEKFASDRVEIK